ncbi:uncharacterized protein LOC130451960 isoform X1 [Diorhabda sublineata]|uniref:uncharacterized protein LOC130451960 isoform X1 n=1 Tax=Diorhabda sublineata TaxID=1163346 RepID=UPI0024E1844A|nr:uncharacterized protein LOC130451960 isoform X1 [Diorhabda sublineata]
MDSSGFKPPSSLVFDQNLHKNYEKFKQHFEIYLKATELSGKSDERKIALFLNSADEEAIEVFSTLSLSEDQKGNYKEVIAAFDNYCKPRNNETFDRFKFFSRNQAEGESMDHFIKDLKLSAKPCNFGTQEDSLIRDRIILGVQDHNLQEKLLGINNLNLETAESTCRTTEASKLQAKDLNKEEVNLIRRRGYSQGDPSTSDSGNNNGREYRCLKCGRRHTKGKCFAFGKNCAKCGLEGHFAVGCKTGYNKKDNFSNSKIYKNKGKYFNSHNRNINSNQHVNLVDENDSSDEDFVINNLTVFNIYENDNSELEKIWTENVCIDNSVIKFKVDSGAQCNVLPISYIKKLERENDIIHSEQSIIAYGNNKIRVVGSIILKCLIKNNIQNVKFLVVDIRGKPILGLKTCVKLNIICKLDEVNLKNKRDPKENFINQNKKLFEGTGKVPFKYRILLKEGYKPVVSNCRRVAEKIKGKLKNTLDELVDKDIIEKVDEPSEWYKSKKGRCYVYDTSQCHVLA